MIYKKIMLVLLTCFYCAYFTKQISLKVKGIHANRLAKGSKPKKTCLIELCLLVITYSIAVTQFLSVILSSDDMESFPEILSLIGVCLSFIGVVFFVLAITTMQSNWRAGIDETQKTNIVSNGIYRVSRNPAFVGFDLLYIGTAIAFPGIAMISLAIIAATVLHLQILEEEKYLTREFGDSYAAYKNKTARYLLF